MIGPDRRIDRRAYTVCVLERLQDSLRRRDVFVRPSVRWATRASSCSRDRPGNPPGHTSAASSAARRSAATEIEAMTSASTRRDRRTAANLPTNTAVRNRTEDGRETANTLEPDAGSPTTTSPPTSSAGFHGIVIRGTLRDSLFILEGRPRLSHGTIFSYDCGRMAATPVLPRRMPRARRRRCQCRRNGHTMM